MKPYLTLLLLLLSVPALGQLNPINSSPQKPNFPDQRSAYDTVRSGIRILRYRPFSGAVDDYGVDSAKVIGWAAKFAAIRSQSNSLYRSAAPITGAVNIASGSNTATLSTVLSTPGAFGTNSSYPKFTVGADGRITAVTYQDMILPNVLGANDSLSAHNSRFSAIKNAVGKSVKEFGAAGNGTTDDRLALYNAMTSAGDKTIVIEPGTYRIANFSTLGNLSDKKIIAWGATILSSDTTKAAFLFQDVKNLQIYGGTWGYSQTIHTNGGGSQHVLQFNRCTNVLVQGISIKNSPEMGISITNSDNITIQGNKIAHTPRDGIYCRYSSNVWILFNKLSNCKDDAISFHDKDNYDAGIDSQKSTLYSYGYKQSSHLYAIGNTIDSCYQGIVSVGGAHLTIANNHIKRVVNSAIAVYNQKNDDPRGVAWATIQGNEIDSAGVSVVINGITYPNNGQSGPGRAAIFVGSTGTNNQIYQGETKRLSNVSVIGNTVTNSGANSFWGGLVDGLSLKANTFRNSAGISAPQSLNGIPVEINYCTDIDISDNGIVDTRATKLHDYGIFLNESSGYLGINNIAGYLTVPIKRSAGDLTLTYAQREGLAAPQPTLINSSTATTNFNSYTLAGTYQVSGASGWQAQNGPSGVANSGGLEVTRDGPDVIVQRYTDNAGKTTSRILNGIASGSWSAWSGIPLFGGLNLSDLTDPAGARNNLGLGTAALQNTSSFLSATGGFITPTYSVSFSASTTTSWGTSYQQLIPPATLEANTFYKLIVWAEKSGTDRFICSYDLPMTTGSSVAVTRSATLTVTKIAYDLETRYMNVRHKPPTTSNTTWAVEGALTTSDMAGSVVKVQAIPIGKFQ